MNILLDTNALIYISRDPSKRFLNEFLNPSKKNTYISIVSIGEVLAIATRQKWNKSKHFLLDEIIENSGVIDITNFLVSTYVEIDNYSQRKNPNFKHYPFKTPRNSGTPPVGKTIYG